jgi:hypothetical protein
MSNIPKKLQSGNIVPYKNVLTSLCQVKKRVRMVVDEDGNELFSDGNILCLKA